MSITAAQVKQLRDMTGAGIDELLENVLLQAEVLARLERMKATTPTVAQLA